MSKLFLKGLVQKADNGDIIVIASDESVDRAGDSIPVKSWDLTNFNKSPRMFVDHDYSVRSITGIWKNTKAENGQLRMTPVFHNITELARVNKEMVDGGWLDTVSVGYIPHNDRNELLEVSWVGVPCNANARIERLSIKDIDGGDAEKIEEFVKDTAPVDAPVEAPVEAPKEGDVVPPLEAIVEKVEKEKKGIIEDTNQATSDMREQKWPMLDAAWCAFDRFCGAFMSDATDVAQYGAMIEDLCASLLALKDAPAPVEMDDDEMVMMRVQSTMQKMVDFRKTKAGRVLSSANRDTIQTAIDAMESGTSALKELLASVDEAKAAGKSAGVESKDKTPEEVKPGVAVAKGQLKEFTLLRRVMQETNTMTADFLAEMRKQLSS